MTDVTERPASRRRTQTRARLLAAAHEVFAEVGMGAASVEMICERAGFTRGAFYSNFESKEELFLALITQMTESKLEEVAGRVRELGPGSTGAGVDPSTLVRQVVGASLGEHMEPQLLSEIRTQALRDPRLAAAYLTWQETMRERVEGIIAHVVESFGLRLRLPLDETAQLLLDAVEDTCTRATLQGRDQAGVTDVLNDRLERLVTVLVVPTAED